MPLPLAFGLLALIHSGSEPLFSVTIGPAGHERFSTHLWKNNDGQPVNVPYLWYLPIGGLAEAGGRPELDLARAGRAGGRIGRRLWAAGLHIATHHTPKLTRNSQW